MADKIKKDRRLYKQNVVILVATLFVAITISFFSMIAEIDKTQKVSDEITKSEFFSNDMISVECIGGESVGFDDISTHQLTVLNIWATTCGPCIEEMPILEEISKENPDQVLILGSLADITNYEGIVDESALNDAKDIIEQTGAQYPQLIPTKEMISSILYDIKATPTTLFIDSAGNIIGVIEGSQDRQSWEKLIDKYLNY